MNICCTNKLFSFNVDGTCVFDDNNTYSFSRINFSRILVFERNITKSSSLTFLCSIGSTSPLKPHVPFDGLRSAEVAALYNLIISYLYSINVLYLCSNHNSRCWLLVWNYFIQIIYINCTFNWSDQALLSCFYFFAKHNSINKHRISKNHSDGICSRLPGMNMRRNHPFNQIFHLTIISYPFDWNFFVVLFLFQHIKFL